MICWLWCLALPLQAATILVFGDSLSAGYGLPQKRGYVTLLQYELGSKHKVVNASLSGETTNGGLTRLPAALKQHQPQIVVLELGANDGLRGLPLSTMRDNLAQMIELARQQGAKPVLVGVPLPPNYGQQYTAKFRGVYDELAQRYHLPYAPSLLDGFEKDRSAFQADGLHPAAGVQQLMSNAVLKVVAPLLK